jgi:hypothetical protein
MVSISKYLLGCRDIETITTREDSNILFVRLENDKSNPELYILENLESNPINKSFIIIEENVSVPFHNKDLRFIGEFEFRNGVHKFFVFEIMNFTNDEATSFIFDKKDIVSFGNIKNIPINKDIDINQKYIRLPKPDFKRLFTREELLDMHPEKQVGFLLLNKYNIPRKLLKKVSINNKIDFILQAQEGYNPDINSFIDIKRKKYERKKISIKRNLNNDRGKQVTFDF